MRTEPESARVAEPSATTTDVAGDELIEFLQTRNNPFDDYVHGSRPSRRVPHVSSVHGDVTDLLARAIDRYCLDWDVIENGGEQELLWSGVIVVDGRRGDGKTHLLQNGLQPANAVLVQPTSFDTFRPFREYLLRQLIDRLQDEPPHRSSLVDLAQWFTRRLLARTVRTMPELDWVCLCKTEHRERGWNPLSRAAPERWLRRRDVLVDELEDAAPQSISDVCEVQGWPPAFLRKLAVGQLRRQGRGRTAARRMHSRIHVELVETAFDPERLEVFDALLGESGDVDADGEPTVGRGTLVDERLSCLVELFLLFGRPVVFAFDGMETLLEDPPNKTLCQAFLNGIAQVVDAIPGIPFLVFAEGGHWNRVRQEGLSSYASQRFERGIPIPGRGAVSTLKLSRIDGDGLAEIVAARMRPLHDAARFTANSDADRLRPLTPADLEEALSRAADDSTPALRVVLQRVRTKYESLVYGRGAATIPEVDSTGPRRDDEESPTSTEEIENLWNREVRAAERKSAQRSLLGSTERLHQGVRIWLEASLGEGLTVNDWRLVEVEMRTFGNHMRYGECVVTGWTRGEERRRLAIAFLLAPGAGMPADLRTKLTTMSASDRVADDMVLLWPRREAVEDAVEALPGATSEAWAEFAAGRHGSRVRLLAVEATQLAPWIALGSIQRLAVDELDVPPPLFAHFVDHELATMRRYLAAGLGETST